MALGIADLEYPVMPKRGPYKKAQPKKPLPWRQTFLAQWRNLRGMTQEELADQSGVSVGLISSIEAAASGYSAESLHKLAGALKIAPGMILSVNPEGAEPLWALIARADPAEREQIARHAGVIVSDKPKRR